MIAGNLPWFVTPTPGQGDAFTTGIKASADLWRDITGQSHDAVAAQIRADSIDILVDLAGHSGQQSAAVDGAQACANTSELAGLSEYDGA